MLSACTLHTPIGTLQLLAADGALRRIAFAGEHAADTGDGERALLTEARGQLAAYFAAELTVFDLPLAPQGTPFQKSVWAALARVPWGETCSYAELARAIDRPRAVRAVGAANGANPLPIILPCHRVIGADGSLTGYAGGLEMKRWLLAMESRPRAFTRGG
jgi:methylated-DNA-[protein]-cysteine S-methyltransferase